MIIGTIAPRARPQAAAELLSTATKPVVLVGPRFKRTCVEHGTGAVPCLPALEALAAASGYGVAVFPDAKGMFPEHHDNYMGEGRCRRGPLLQPLDTSARDACRTCDAVDAPHLHLTHQAGVCQC